MKRKANNCTTSSKKNKHTNDTTVDDTIINTVNSTSNSTSIIPVLDRRDGSCPLQYNLLREILEWVHDDLRFTLDRHGLGNVIIIIIINTIIIIVIIIVIRYYE